MNTRAAYKQDSMHTLCARKLHTSRRHSTTALYFSETRESPQMQHVSTAPLSRIIQATAA